LYSMTAEETVVRLEAAPKLNTQMGPMFNGWLRRNFTPLGLDAFQRSARGVCILDTSEEAGKEFINDTLHQNLAKRPDLIAKVNRQIIIGEAKWVGQPGGNQEKQVQEVLNFCRHERGDVIRIGVVDGFPWSVFNINHRLVNNKEAVNIQESEYDLVSALLLQAYLQRFL
jgi:Tsp45I type II restriction enzyme